MKIKRAVFVNGTNRIPIRTMQIVKTFRKLDIEVFFINWQRSLDVDNNFTNIPYINLRSRNWFTFILSVIKFLLKADFDCIYCSDVRFIPFLLLIKKIKKTKLFYDYKEYPAATFSYKLMKRLGIRNKNVESIFITFFKKIESIFLYYTDGIVSIPIKQNGISCHPNAEVIFNVPSITDKADINDIRFFRDKYSNYELLIYAGTVFNYEDRGLNKTINCFLRLKKEFSNIKLLIIAADSQKQQRLAKISYLPSDDSIEILPYLPYNKLLGLLSIAKIGFALYNPNDVKFKKLSIGASRKIFTYMLCGLPIVASDMPLNQVVEEEKCGFLVDYTNSEEIYDACFKLLTDKKLWSKFSTNAKNAILTKYNWENEEEKILNILEKL